MVLFSLYLIVSATLLVQSFHSAGRSNFLSNANPLRGYQRIAFPQSKDSNSHDFRLKPSPLSAKEIRHVLNKLLQEVAAPPLKEQKRESSRVKTQHAKHSPLPLEAPKHKTCAGAMGAKPEWAKWTEWSPCSVSCGKGREIRWRHCVRSCDGMETEMEEKTCQLPACGGKLFGLIKL
ncbi:hypothetical protein MTP99_008457 [Tenebrio molitor]|uniref:adhesion G protein-coupled receptor B2-like isoform X1 n=1 Tax=Tenebrio molitor TaxID=7067 RepID=UPI0027101B78|nr:hypothetical protein MTP99_008457 [Tenebrio molitor]